MCFSERQSFANVVALLATALYRRRSVKLSASLAFLASKDLIQALLYRALRQGRSTHLLTVLSWVHVSFQPFFCNFFLQHFDPDHASWNAILGACVLFAAFNLTVLRELDVQGDPPCRKKNDRDDFCSQKTESYMGKFHVAYRFALDDTRWLSKVLYNLLLLAPFLTGAWKLNAVWLGSIAVLHAVMHTQSVGSGETASMWCFLSILIAIPFALLDTRIAPAT